MIQKSLTRLIIVVFLPILACVSVHSDSVIELKSPPRWHYTEQHLKVEWGFHFDKPLTLLEAEILDIKREPVASLITGKESRGSGDTEFAWTPGDKDSEDPSDGVYHLKITARDENGTIHEFPEPVVFSPYGVDLDNLEIKNNIIQFDNPRRGFVTIRAGYGSGPRKALCFSVVNWEFMDEGRQVIPWNAAMTDAFNLSAMPDVKINASCYPLPEGSFRIDRGRKAGDRQFELTLNENDLLFLHDANRYRYDIGRGDFALSVTTQLVPIEGESGYRLLFTVSGDNAPVGWLDTPGLVHEVKAFIDGRQVFGAPAETFPFSGETGLNALTPGDHLLVINAWDNSNRFGIWNGTLNMNDAGQGARD